MTFRSASRVVMATALWAAVAGAAAGAPAQTMRVLEPALPNPPVAVTSSGQRFAIAYRPFDATPFGQRCRICPDDIAQRELADCFLLSSLGAVAAASPDLIRASLVEPAGDVRDEEGNRIYSVRLHVGGRTLGYPVASRFPAESQGYGLLPGFVTVPQGPVDFVNNLFHLNFGNLTMANFVYALPAGSGTAERTSWPMLFEKAYALSLAGGYGDRVLQAEGGLPSTAMTELTGYPSEVWNIDSRGTPLLLLAFTVHDSPVVDNTGSHSVIAGLLRGDLRAIQPNLKVCVTPAGERYGRCAPTCHESHQCQQAFGGGGVRLTAAALAKTHLEVYDVNGPNRQNLVASGDLNPEDCRDEQGQQPCRIDTPNGPLLISFMMNARHDALAEEAAKTIASPAELDAFLANLNPSGTPVMPIVAGSIHSCAGVQGPCAGEFGNDVPGKLEYGHAYIFKGYRDKTVYLRDPHGWDMPLGVEQFFHRFEQLAVNRTPRAAASCGCN